MSDRTGSRSTLPCSASKSVCSQPLTTPVSSVAAAATSRTGAVDGHRLTRLDQVRGDVDLLVVDRDVAVVDELPGLGARAGEPEPVDDVVQPPLEQRQQLLAGHALGAVGLVDVAAELAFADAVVALRGLLGPQLRLIDRRLAPAGLPVLPGRSVTAALQRRLAVEGALALQEQLDALTA